MATISENLNKLINVKEVIKESIIDKGGAMSDNTPFRNYAEEIHNLPDNLKYLANGTISVYKLPNVISSLRKCAFAFCTNITSVGADGSDADITLPKGLVRIDDMTFLGCSGLTNVDIPSTVTSMGSQVFSGCTNLPSIVIHDSMSSIGTFAFTNCYKLQEVTLGKNLSNIPNNCFQNCSGLTNIVIPDGKIISLGVSAFTNCYSLTSVTFNNYMNKIDNSCFQNCSGLTEIAIPDNVITIGYSAFTNCVKLKTVTIGDNVQTISNTMFSGCTALTSVQVGSGVTSFDGSAFRNCYRLTSINLPQRLDLIGSDCFNACSGLTSIDIPQSVRNIGSNAFTNCKGLRDIYCHWTIPPTNGQVFSGCTTGGTLHVPVGTTNNYKTKWSGGTTSLLSNTLKWNIVEDQEVDEPINVLTAKYNVTTTGNTTLYYSNNMFGNAGTGATGSTLTIDGVDKGYYSANTYAFTSIGEKEVNINSSPSAIPNNAFANNKSLIEVNLPKSTKSIGTAAFSGCSNLQKITYEGTQAEFKLITYGNANWRSGTTINEVECLDGNYILNNFKIVTTADTIVYTDTIPTLTAITEEGKSDISGNTILAKSAIKEIVYSYKVSVITNNSKLGNCINLEKVTTPPIFNTIDGGWFDKSLKLSMINSDVEGEAIFPQTLLTFSTTNLLLNNLNFNKVVLPNTLASIDSSAFNGCSNLTDIEIPNSVTSIGNNAFQGCSGLTSIEIPNSVTSIGNSAFSGCTRLTSIEIPNSVTSIGQTAFANCINATDITIGDGLKTIPNSAFTNCAKLEHLTISDNVEEILTTNFTSLANLKSVNSDEAGVVNLPKNLRRLQAAFRDSKHFTDVNFGENIEHLIAESFSACTNISAVTFVDDYSLVELSRAALDNSIWYKNYYNDDNNYENNVLYLGSIAIQIKDKTAKDVVVREGTKGLSNRFLSGNTSVTSVTLPESLELIGGSCFRDCTNLTRINSDEDGIFNLSRIKTIASSYHFANNKKLRKIKLPSSTTYPSTTLDLESGKGWFSGCTNLVELELSDLIEPNIISAICVNCVSLEKVKIGKNTISLEASNFSGCTSLKEIEIPYGVVTMGESQFKNCTSLTHLELPNSVSGIGIYLCDSCTSLTSITLSDLVSSVPKAVFSGCTNLKYISFGNNRTTVPTLSDISAFQNTNDCQIIVPDTLYDKWITSTNWNSSTHNINKRIVKYSKRYDSNDNN